MNVTIITNKNLNLILLFSKVYATLIYFQEKKISENCPSGACISRPHHHLSKPMFIRLTNLNFLIWLKNCSVNI